LQARHASSRGEAGVFLVDDAQGRIDGLLPGDPQYLNRAMQLGRRRVIFRRGQRPGSTVDLAVNGGARLMFYVVPGSGVQSMLRRNPHNRPGRTPVMLLADGRWNPRRVNHLRTSPLPNGMLLRWEDGLRPGHRDFKDVIISAQVV
jgi:hypothetical protein